MNYSAAIKAIETYFLTFWDNRSVIAWGSDDPRKPANKEPWVRFNINHNDGKQASMGSPNSNKFRQIGIITIQVFQPEGNYGISAKEFTNDIIDAYQGLQDSEVTYYNVRANEIGNDGFGWYQTNVIIEFYYDTIT